jgi:hypothetical protein
MAIVVLALWLFTAGAGFYLLVTSNLGRARPAAPRPAAEPAPASATLPAAGPAPASATLPAAGPAPASAAPHPSKREIRAARDRFAPPSLVAAKSAPAVPGLRSLLEFAHPASAIVGLGFWLAYTFVHYRTLGWIAFGLVTATVCLGLTWFAANRRAATRPARPARPGIPARPARQGAPGDDPPPSFSARLVVLHGGAAAVTFALAALTAFALGR